MQVYRIRVKADNQFHVLDVAFSQLCDYIDGWHPANREEKVAFWNGEKSVNGKGGNIKLMKKFVANPYIV